MGETVPSILGTTRPAHGGFHMFWRYPFITHTVLLTFNTLNVATLYLSYLLSDSLRKHTSRLDFVDKSTLVYFKYINLLFSSWKGVEILMPTREKL